MPCSKRVPPLRATCIAIALSAIAGNGSDRAPAAHWDRTMAAIVKNGVIYKNTFR